MPTELLPLAGEPFIPPTDRDMLPSEREFVRTHRTAVFGHARRADGPAMSIVYYVPTTDDELLVSTMGDRAKAKAVERSGKVSLCVLDESWPTSYLQVYCDAFVSTDADIVVDVMMAVGGRMSGEALPDEARPVVQAMAEQEQRVVLRCRPYETFAQPPRHLHRNDQAETITHWISASMPWDAVDPRDLIAPYGAMHESGRVMGVRWGLSLALAGELADPAVVAEVAADAEAAGWDGVFVWDHLWNRTGAPFGDPWVTLAAIAVATERIRIGTLVVAMARRRPQLVAQAATTIDRLSNGRLILGLGFGTDSHDEYSTFGEPLTDDRARAAALDRGIELLLPMLAGAPVPQAGNRRTTVAGAQLPRGPIWVAGTPGRVSGPRRAIRHGLDGVALASDEEWRAEHVTDALAAAGVAAGVIDVVLVGGRHPEPDRLAAAGATWLVPEILDDAAPGAARAIARSGPPVSR